MPRRKALTLVASMNPQLRKAAPRDWSKHKARAFLSVLGETCNVSEACRRSGVPMTVAYRRRKMDAAFRAGWLEAIAAAYQRLELVLLDRAFNGTEKVIRRRDGSEERMLEYATPLGEGRFRLSRLLRGRGGTEWASATHGGGDIFCLIDRGALQPVSLPSWSTSAIVSAAIAGGASTSIQFAAQALRPPSPINLTAARQPNGDLVLGWIRRSRQGFAWTDEVDAPLGEALEQYRVTIAGSLSTFETLTAEPGFALSVESVVALGTGPAMIEVRQVGDFAASRPAQLNLNLS